MDLVLKARVYKAPSTRTAEAANDLPFELGWWMATASPWTFTTSRAQDIGFHPQLILAGRRINDGMGIHVARQAIKPLIQAGRPVKGVRALVPG